jgi:FecR protein
MKRDDLELWPAQKPPLDFAEGVVRAARAPSPRSARGRGRRIAAGMLLVASLAAGVAFAAHLRGRTATGDVVAVGRQEVRVGTRAVAVLEPGARVAWNGDEVRQTSGDVFWRVEPGARFAVKTPEGEVTVKGTCFRVKVIVGAGLAAAVIVAVYEGRVSLAHGRASVDVAAGESARADEEGVRATPGEPDRPASTAAPAEHAVATLDREKADRMRAQLRALLGVVASAGTDEPAASASAAPSAFPTMPLVPRGDAGDLGVDPKYIQSVVRDQYFPLAKQCYSDALERNPKLGGKFEMSFTILGDPKIGGVVDDLKTTPATTIDDTEMLTCMRESMMAVSFDAPPEGGSVTVVYPIVFSPGDDDGG